MLQHTIKYLEVSKARPSPSRSPHHPCSDALPVNAWQTTTTLSRVFGLKVPYVW